ncbi:MAG: lysophospholipid acyltransferase family protein [Alphaproteobacteria bacterium]|nr:lysophospholipid acyltransferase family protein [Alphaproteobacteria bacterium]
MKTVENIAAILNGILRTTAFLLVIALLIPVALIYKRCKPEDPFKIPRFFHRIVLLLTGIRVRVHGTASSAGGVLFVSNHTSYLDIPVLGSLLPTGFVAKAEVARWPLFGFLAKIQNTVFIERRATRVAEQSQQLQEYLAKRRNLVLFPEGTSSDGLEVLPFKSSLFAIVEDAAGPILVQPVSITCTEFDGFPMLREDRAQYAWYGDMTMVPHLWNVFQNSSFVVDVVFHRTIAPQDYSNRKDLAAACQSLVAQGIEHSIKTVARPSETISPCPQPD